MNLITKILIATFFSNLIILSQDSNTISQIIPDFQVNENAGLWAAEKWEPSIAINENGDFATGIKHEKNAEIPTQFYLSQNYPNPFNPSTNLKYSIPSDVKRVTKNVKLVVFDILGREVAKLVNQKQKPGNYEVSWDTKNQPSGVYFYQLTTHNYVETKKMIFLK